MKNILIAITLLLFSTLSVQAKDKETAYERIMRTGTIRCGYVIYEPGLSKDPKTGEYSGIVYDLVKEIANRLSLKLEMTNESTFGTIGEDLSSGKSDLICTLGWKYIPNIRAHIISSDPILYNTVGAYVRGDDHRFDNNLALINDPSVSVAAVDATIASDIAREDFPKAKVLSMPKITPYEFNIMNVMEKKADVTFIDPDYAERFLAKQKNKGVLRNIAKDKPLRLFASGLLLPMGEVELEQMINMSIEALHNEGFIEKLITKYEASSGSLIRVSPGYQIKH